MKRSPSAATGEPPPKRPASLPLHTPLRFPLSNATRYTVDRAVLPVRPSPFVEYTPPGLPSDGRRPALPGERGWVVWPKRADAAAATSSIGSRVAAHCRPSPSLSDSDSEGDKENVTRVPQLPALGKPPPVLLRSPLVRPPLPDVVRLHAVSVSLSAPAPLPAAVHWSRRSRRNSRSHPAAAAASTTRRPSPRSSCPWWTPATNQLSRQLPMGERGECEVLPADRHSTGRNHWSHNTCSVLATAAGQPLRVRTDEVLAGSALDPLFQPYSTAPKGPMRGCRFRVYPTRNQRELLYRWMAACRRTYNQAADAINKGTVPHELGALSRAFVSKRSLGSQQQWMADVPSSVRQGAVRDAFFAFKAYKARRPHNQDGFHLKFRSVRDPVQSLVVLKGKWNQPNTRNRSKHHGVFSTQLLRGGREYRRLLENGLPHDSRLLRDAKHRWFLCVPFTCRAPPPLGPSASRPRNVAAAPSHRVVAIDPGVRTFLTTYDLQGKIHEWGVGDLSRLYRLALHVDTLESKASRAKHRKRYRIRRAAARVRERVRNLVDDVHRKACSWLCATYDTIALPRFDTGGIVRRKGRRLTRGTVRSMLRWAHYRFRQRLLSKAATRGVRVELITEEWTSKTCGTCARLHHALGGSKHFRCPSCGWRCDRDVNGARNIMLKALTPLR